MPPLKLAIVGGGPSAFYVASRLLSLLPKTSAHSPTLKIHLYDRLWAPYGLVRYGVAPDHPEVKVNSEAAEDDKLPEEEVIAQMAYALDFSFQTFTPG